MKRTHESLKKHTASTSVISEPASTCGDDSIGLDEFFNN